MDSKKYAEAKKVFFDLVDRSPEEQARQLHSLELEDKSLADEVSLLLANHSSRTIISSHESTQNASTATRGSYTVSWIRVNRFLYGGWVPLVVAIASTAILFAIGWYIHKRLYEKVRSEYERAAMVVADQKVRRVLQWTRWHEQQVLSWAMRDDIQELVARLDSLAQSIDDPAELETALRNADEQRKLSMIFNQLTPPNLSLKQEEDLPPLRSNPRMKFAIWNRSFQLIADWQYQNESVQLGESASSTGKITVSKVLDTNTTHVEMPRPKAETVSKDYPIETNLSYVMFFVPIFSPSDNSRPIGAMMIRSDSLLDELREILEDVIFSDSNCYLLTKEGGIATRVLDSELVATFQNVSPPGFVRGGPVLYARDPGVNLMNGETPTTDSSVWPATLAAMGIANQKDGHSFDGYRDYRGQNVVGAWRWIEKADIGIVMETPRERAYGNLVYIDQAFRVMYSIPLIAALALVVFSLIRYFRTHDLTNKTVGAYRLKSKIGEGGLGVVYEGEHHILGRKAAIKLIKPGAISSGTVRRFEREVKLASLLNHQNAVAIYDFGVSRDGLLYCAMELVDGVTLSQLLSFEPNLPIERTLHFLWQVSLALQEAHNLQLVHRDIKPQNVMICQAPVADLVKVVDFGLAKSISETISRDVTATRAVMGTPGFIAPERLESPWSADPKIDTFSFGVLGMYMLTAKIPPLGVSKEGFVAMIQNPSLLRSLESPDLQSLIDLLLACASPLPESRPKNIRAVSEEIRTLCKSLYWNRGGSEAWWSEQGDAMRTWVSQGKTESTPS
ncbi:serine/threonine-protein kinase [Pirellulaceae bacterium SH467]